MSESNSVGATPPNPPPKPTGASSQDDGMPAAFQAAGFSAADYAKFKVQLLNDVIREMQKSANKAIQQLKEQRRKIESGEG